MAGTETATLAGGCFWCLEALYKDLRGVVSVVPGYSGGRTPHPTYEEVCSDRTGHAECVQIEFEPDEISYRDLLGVFFAVHDPTTPNRQGHDAGSQYRSVIFCHTKEQQDIARDVIAALEGDPSWEGEAVVTEVVPFETFYPAEPYHRDYFAKNPQQGYCRVVIAPKVAKFRKRFPGRIAVPH